MSEQQGWQLPIGVQLYELVEPANGRSFKRRRVLGLLTIVEAKRRAGGGAETPIGYSFVLRDDATGGDSVYVQGKVTGAINLNLEPWALIAAALAEALS